MDNKRKNIMVSWKEFNPLSEKSMKEDFQTNASPNCQKIVDYLNNGNLSLISASCGVDIFTGERIVDTCCILTDGEFSWLNTLGYYVEHYNLKLPQEFERKIIGAR